MVCALYRWLRRGIGGIRLESIKVGGATYTSKEALQRFADRLSEATHSPSATPISTTTTRKKQIDQAERQAQAILHSSRVEEPPGWLVRASVARYWLHTRSVNLMVKPGIGTYDAVKEIGSMSSRNEESTRRELYEVFLNLRDLKDAKRLLEFQFRLAEAIVEAESADRQPGSFDRHSFLLRRCQDALAFSCSYRMPSGNC